MDQKFRTSFIPKQEIASVRPKANDGLRLSIFSIIAVALLIISILAALGVFLYQKKLIGDINNMDEQLAAVRNSFDPGLVDTLIRLDHRIEAGKKVLATHNAVTPVFGLLEEQTLKNVRLTGFDYLLDTGGKVTLNLEGEAVDFLTVAAQADVWNGEKRILKPIFSDLSLNEGGDAFFNLRSPLDAEKFSYKELVAAKKATSTEAVPIEAGVEVIEMTEEIIEQ